MREPQENQIVFVHGGIAQYRSGAFYTGMEDPRYERPIKWPVTWWHPIDFDPVATFIDDHSITCDCCQHVMVDVTAAKTGEKQHCVAGNPEGEGSACAHGWADAERREEKS